ncbi:MAG: HYR domain-containing protein [Nibricoccus sp.]
MKLLRLLVKVLVHAIGFAVLANSSLFALDTPTTPVTGAIAAGYNHVVTLKSDGTVWTWGENAYGQLGDGTTTSRTTAVQVSGLTDIVAVSAGYYHSVALKSDGTVWTWGGNGNGQLGNGTTVSRTTPIQIAGLNGIVAVDAGHSYTVSLKDDGTVWAWGDNAFGQLGDGTTTQRTTAVQMSGLNNVVGVVAGNSHTVVLKNDGTVWACGRNLYGEVGDGSLTQRTTATSVSGLSGVVAIATGSYHSLALKNDGTVLGWGSNSGGKLGNGTWTNQSTPVTMTGMNGAVALAAGMDHTMVLKNDGTVWACGSNTYGQLGNGNTGGSVTSTIAQVNSITGAVAISANGEYGVALINDGTVSSWGSNIRGQLGDGTTTYRNTAVAVSGLQSVTAVATGYRHMLALRNDGSLWAWGYNAGGVLGNNSSVNSTVPVSVLGLNNVTAASAGNSHSVALKSDGTVWAWGYNNYGQLGDGTTVFARQSAAPVMGLKDVAAISSGFGHNVALKGDGTVWTWGLNTSGQLGDYTNTNRNIPISASGLNGIVAVAAGYAHTLALKNDGTVWAWGDNSYGQLGSNTTTTGYAPVQVTELSDVVSISAGNNHSIALKSDGSAWAWGSNSSGQLGDSTTNTRLKPIQMVGLSGIISIKGGTSYTIALKDDGAVWSCGYNIYGQLGDGTYVNQKTAVQIIGLGGIAQIAAGDRCAVALKNDGTLRGWGDDTNGQLAFASWRPTRAAIRLTASAIDADQDGMDDVWELQYFGDLGHSGNADADGDGLTDIQEFVLGTNPTLADGDGDLLTDFVDAHPNDFYNNITPSLSIVGGDNQSAAPNTFNSLPLDVAVWNVTPTAPLAHAPVSFAVTSGEGSLAASITGDLLQNLTVRADQDGTAQVFFKHGPSVGITSTVTVTAGNVQLEMHSTTNNKQNQTITFDDPGQQIYGAPLTLNATASSGLPVTFVPTSGPVTIANGVATFTGIGSVTITAVQAGDDIYTAAPNVARTFDVVAANQPMVAVTPTAVTTNLGESVTFTASGGITNYVWGGSASGTGATQSVTFNSAGTFSVSVHAQAGGNYAQSNTATAVVTVFAPPPVNAAPATPNGSYQMMSGYEDGAPIVFNLFQNFDDAETPDAGLRYYFSTDKPELFTSATIDNQTGLLTLVGAPNLYGYCQCVVTAEDPQGLKAEIFLTVDLMPVNDAPVVTGFSLVTNGDPLPLTKENFDTHCVDEMPFQSLRFESVPVAGSIVSMLPRFTASTKSLYQGAASMVIGDFDGDGDSDVVIGHNNDNYLAWYENTGGANFITRSIATSRLMSVVVGDFDKDGDLDFAGLEPGTTSNVVWWRNDGGSPRVFTRVVIESIPFASLGFGCQSADIDGDGNLDIVTSSSGTLQIYVNDGGAAPTFTRRTVGGTSVVLRAVCDVDGDGDSDLVSSETGGVWSVWSNSGGTFTRRNYAIPYASGMLYMGSMIPADLDGDGDLDFAVNFADSNWGNSVGWEEQVAGGGFVHHRVTPRDSGIGQVYLTAVHDIDGDGDKDLLVNYPSVGDSTRWYETIGVPTERAWNIFPAPSDAMVVLGTPDNPSGELLSLRTYYDGSQTRSILTVLTHQQSSPIVAGSEVPRTEIDKLIYLPERPGNFEFSWSVFDGMDRSNVAIGTIRVLDTAAPVITVPATITVEATSAEGAIVTFAPTAIDLADGVVAVSSMPASGSIFPLGATAVTLTATDAAGNTATNTFTVNVQDTTAPVITVPETLTAEATTNAGASVALIGTATDVVSGNVPVTFSPATNINFPLGETIVTASATDGAGNTSTATLIVKVVDTVAPVLTLPADITAEATGPAGAAVTFSAQAVDAINGALGVSYSAAPGSIFPVGQTTVTVTAVDVAGNVVTGSFKITVVDIVAPTITVPANQTLEATSASGATATFSATASDLVDGPIAVALSHASGSTFPLGTTLVTLTATDAAGNSATGSFNITVRDTTAPVLVVPANIALNGTDQSGTAVTYSTAASDLVDGDVTVVASMPSGSLFPLGLTTVTLNATDAAGNRATGSFTISVGIGSPFVNMPPVSQTVAVGAPATFSVGAVGTRPFTYQWRKGSTPIAGATDATFTIPSAQTTDAGSYSVVVSNPAGSMTSSAATLSVKIPPSITTQPINATVTAGKNASFRVVASGSTTLAYQWYFNGVAISGANAATCTITAAQSANAGVYSVVVSNMVGNATSAGAILTVNNPVVITSPPASLSITVGSTATFSVEATGTAPFTYQWRRNSVAIAGATSSSYIVPSAQTADAGNYTVVVTNPAGSVTSATAVLKVNVPPVITTQPVNKTVTAGTTVTFRVVATGTAPLTYQWMLNGIPVAGATAASYSIVASSSTIGTYAVVVTNVAGNITSADAILALK